MRMEQSLKELKELLIYAPPSNGGIAYTEAKNNFEINIEAV
jgi:hypothetical protein